MINPYIFLQLDSIGSIFGISISAVQVMPVISVISLFFFVFIWFYKEGLKISISEIFVILIILIYLIIISVIEIYFNNWSPYYINGFFRQSISLIVFLSMYLMFRLISKDYKYIFYGVYLGIFLLIPISIFQLLDLVFSSKRLSGFSSEPSHFGHFLVFALIPALILLRERIKFYKILIIYCNILVFLTFSITALFQLFILYFVIFFNFNLRNLLLFFTFLALIGVGIFLSQDSYLFSNLKLFLSLEAFEDGISVSASLADRYYSVVAPIKNLGSSISIFGNGIASDYYYFNNLVPYPANELIANQRSGYVGFSSFFAKVICWGGLPLLTALTTVLVSLYRNADIKVRRFIIPVIIASTYSLGSLATPYICLWLAILRLSNIKISNQ